MHRPEAELKALLEEAAAQVSVGSRYAHYKDPAHTYLVTGIAINRDTFEPHVIYTAEYGEGLQFTRSLREWLSPALVDGASVIRFRKL